MVAVKWYARADYLKKRFDFSLLYYRRTDLGNVQGIGGTLSPVRRKIIYQPVPGGN